MIALLHKEKFTEILSIYYLKKFFKRRNIDMQLYDKLVNKAE